MYNVSKGGNTLNESEILEPVHACLRELLERDRQGKTHLIKYTDDDVIAITLLYAHILGNRLIHRMTDEKVSIGMSQELANHYSVLINEVTNGMSNVNTNVFYKRREEKK